jgi:hypothetical protein
MEAIRSSETLIITYLQDCYYFYNHHHYHHEQQQQLNDKQRSRQPTVNVLPQSPFTHPLASFQLKVSLHKQFCLMALHRDVPLNSYILCPTARWLCLRHRMKFYNLINRSTKKANLSPPLIKSQRFACWWQQNYISKRCVLLN